MRPILMGSAMAVMMLAMLHRPIMEGTLSLGTASVGFVLAHLAVAGGVLALATFVPAVRRRIRSHRPSVRHVLAMLVGAVVVAGTTHALIHGGWV